VILENLYKYGYKILFIQGDKDGIISLSGVWKTIQKRKFPTTRAWTPWISKYDGEFVGFLKEYGSFTLATIHGIGHEAYYRKYTDFPDLLTNFMLNKSLFD